MKKQLLSILLEVLLKRARRGSLSPRCDLAHRVAAGGGAKSRQDNI